MVYENDEPSEIDTLVYAEDLSRNGTYWNGSFIGKGNGGFLLSEGDTLRLSNRTHFLFNTTSSDNAPESFDHIQETEMAVRPAIIFSWYTLTRTEIPQGLHLE